MYKKSIILVCIIILIGSGLHQANWEAEEVKVEKLKKFLIKKEELNLKYSHLPGKRMLSFKNVSIPPALWKQQTRKKLKEILKIADIQPGKVKILREIKTMGVTIQGLIMSIDKNLSIPAYLLIPDPGKKQKSAVMAIHGHGAVEPAIGLVDDYHHCFALELAKEGHLVLAPELRGFSTLNDLAHQLEINRLDYWIGRYSQFTLVTDGFLYGDSLIGETVEDLLRWEEWLASTHGLREIDVTGISYGGDLAIIYPVFSQRIRRIFASGTMGSFSVIFQRCYNAPAHCIPNILTWMDRSDIAGLNAPRPMAVHYGELDAPSPTNASASYNETVPQSMKELKDIYKAFGGEGAVKLIVTKGKHHEMDITQLLAFFDK